MHRKDQLKLQQSRMNKTGSLLDVIRRCSKIIRYQRKEFIQYYNLRGVAFAKLTIYAKAIADFNMGIKLLSKESDSDFELMELFLFNRAMVYFLLRQYSSAADDLDRVAFLNQTAAYPCFYQGIVSSAQGNDRQACDYFLFALILDPGKDRYDNIGDEENENQIEVDDRRVNFGVLLQAFKTYETRDIYRAILSFPFEQSIALFQQCKDPTTFLGEMCVELNEKKKEQITSAINYRMLMKMGITKIFSHPALLALDKQGSIKSEPHMLSRSQ